MKNFPNFVVIGVSKSGTTSLHHYLHQHPEIYMSSIKEPQFFVFEGLDNLNNERITTLEAYLDLFKGVTQETAIGEVSPQYFHSPIAPLRIQHYNPEMKIIAIIRQPIERAYSHYNMLVNFSWIPKVDFVDVFRENQNREEQWYKNPCCCYGFQHSFYFESLNRYFKRFGSRNIKVLLYEDYIKKNNSFFQDIFKFLDIETNFIPNSNQHHNQSILMKNKNIFELITKQNPLKNIAKAVLPEQVGKKLAKQIHQMNTTTLPKLAPEIRQEFTQVYAEDIKKTEHLIEKDLSSWLT